MYHLTGLSFVAGKKKQVEFLLAINLTFETGVERRGRLRNVCLAYNYFLGNPTKDRLGFKIRPTKWLRFVFFCRLGCTAGKLG